MRTRSLALVPFALLSLSPAQDAVAREIDVRVDPRTEVLSIVFRLAGNPEYRQGKIDAYTKAVDEHFGKYAKEAVVGRARQLRGIRGVSFDAPMSLAVHLEPGTSWKMRVPLDPWPENLDERWTEDDVKAFLRDLARFARRSKFEQFFREHSELYDTACGRIREVLDEHTEMAWFDEFYGERPSADFTLCVGLLQGGGNYGPRVRLEDGGEELYSILGAWKTDDEGLPVYDDSFVSTIVHEFSHSYCNHLIDAHLDELREPAEAIWPYVSDAMSSQAYGNWPTMLRESLVRACVVRYLAATRGDRAGKMEVEVQKRRSFLWTGELSDLLAEYEANREKCATLAEFMPRVVEFFAEYAPKLEAELANVPKVVSILPANETRDVDPATEAIVVTFDRPMLKGARAIVRVGRDTFPEIGEVSFDDTGTVLTIPVTLEPKHDYELWLNRGRFQAFQSADRVMLRPYRYRFRTKG